MTPLPEPSEVLVIGAGAAGLMAAIACRHQGMKTTLLDGRETFGAKILMSGGTRCNVTNQKVTERNFSGEDLHAVRNVLAAFPAPRAADFFRSIGVALLVEEGGKYFPETHSARTVLEALIREAERLGVEIRTGCKVTSLAADGNVWKASGDGFSLTALTVILCTGGLSYPTTGSDGTGYHLAAALGHGMVETSPALTPLLTDDGDWKKLSGVALPCRLRLSSEGRTEAEYEGAMLFTHFGFSGPVVLNMSRHWIRCSDPHRELAVNFLPSTNQEHFRQQCLHEGAKNPTLLLRNFLSRFLPERLADTLLHKARLSRELILNQWSREAREHFLRGLYHQPLRVTGGYGYTKAEVTAGGVSWKDVDTRTLESRKCPGLFFAGEIMDVDGRIGGYNFQWAWSSGVAAADGAARRLGRKPVRFPAS